MKILKNNWRIFFSVILLYFLATLAIILIINAHILSTDTNQMVTRLNNFSSSQTQTTTDNSSNVSLPKRLPASTNNAATKAIRSGASYAQTLNSRTMTVTIAVYKSGEIQYFLQLRENRLSTTFYTWLISCFGIILCLINLWNMIRRTQKLRKYTSETVAKIKSIERSPLTQNYLITKDDDKITTALNHLGETIQTRITSDAEVKENLYEFIEFFQFPIFVYDGKGAIHRANSAFQNEFSSQPSIDIFSAYPEFLTFLVEKMNHPDIQDQTFFFENIHSYYNIQFNPLPRIENRYLVAMNDVTRYHRIIHAHNDFVANVSHEFKTPLVSMRGFADLLVENPSLDSSAHYQATLISKESNRLLSLVSDTLQLTKQHSHISKKKLELSGLITEILNTFSSQIQAKNLKIINSLNPCEFKSNANMLHVIFKNLIENAIYYTPENGEIRLNLSTSVHHVKFSISDTGAGLSNLEQERIFERFYRTDTAHQNPNGTGLGLALVEKNIHDLGGHIHVESQVGQGTTFTVLL